MTKCILTFSLLLLFTEISCQQPKKEKTGTEPVSTTPLFPKSPIGWVSDFEKLFQQKQIHYLDSVIGNYAYRTKNEIAVVTLKVDPALIRTDAAFDSLSYSLFNTWKVGKDEKDNGVCLLIAASLRRTRIEVGTGLMSKLTNEEAKQLIDSVLLPHFKNADYFGGTKSALQVIMKELE